MYVVECEHIIHIITHTVAHSVYHKQLADIVRDRQNAGAIHLKAVCGMLHLTIWVTTIHVQTMWCQSCVAADQRNRE